MNHELLKEWVQLSIYNELDENEQQLLAKHLQTCDECRDELAKLERMSSLLNRAKKWEPDDELLREARLELRAVLRLEKKRKERWTPITEFFGKLASPKAAFALGGPTLLVAGFFGGYLMFHNEVTKEQPTMLPQASTASFVQGEAKIRNVHFVSNPQAGGEVEFTFDAITPVHIKGNVDDERVQKVLTHALLNEDNPGVRLRSVSAIALQTEQPRQLQDQSIKNALLKALRSDENPAVRKEALKALRKFAFDDDVKKAFLNVLMYDNNSGIRIAVINLLDSVKVEGKPLDQDILEVLKQRMKSDDNNYIRIKAKEALGEIRQ